MVCDADEEPAGGEQVEVVDDEQGHQAAHQVAQVATQHGGAPTEPGRETVCTEELRKFSLK